jgi:hypothetical protein
MSNLINVGSREQRLLGDLRDAGAREQRLLGDPEMLARASSACTPS